VTSGTILPGGHRPSTAHSTDDRATTGACVSEGAGRGRRGETREEIVARVAREQEVLHPTPVYGARSLRRLRVYLIAIVPIGLALAWTAGLAFGWNAAEWIGFAVGLWLALGYIGYVLLAERDDGRIQADVRRLMECRED
jgi:hypothetical protein